MKTIGLILQRREMLRVSGLTARESLVVHLQLGTPWGSAQDRAVSGEKESTMATWGQKDEPSYERLQNTRF